MTIQRADPMACRPGCAACCIAISISSPLPGMPAGKFAGVACNHLESQTLKCRLWGSAIYPAVCRNFQPHPEHCGNCREDAMELLAYLEQATKPGTPP